MIQNRILSLIVRDFEILTRKYYGPVISEDNTNTTQLSDVHFLIVKTLMGFRVL